MAKRFDELTVKLKQGKGGLYLETKDGTVLEDILNLTVYKERPERATVTIEMIVEDHVEEE